MHYGCRVVGKLMLQINDEIDEKKLTISKAQSSAVNNKYYNVYILGINVNVGFVNGFERSHRLKLDYNCLQALFWCFLKKF